MGGQLPPPFLRQGFSMTKLAKYLIPVLVAVILLVVLAAQRPTDVSANPGAIVTITAPGAVDLGALPYDAGTAKQVVAHGTDGSVTVTGLTTETYTLRVTGSPTLLTSGANTLTNALMIATGEDGTELGDVSVAASLTSGNYADPGGTVVALTGAAQDIATGLTAATVVLKLTAFQKIDANEDHPGGTYQLTLTYTSEVIP